MQRRLLREVGASCRVSMDSELPGVPVPNRVATKTGRHRCAVAPGLSSECRPLGALGPGRSEEWPEGGISEILRSDPCQSAAAAVVRSSKGPLAIQQARSLGIHGLHGSLVAGSAHEAGQAARLSKLQSRTWADQRVREGLAKARAGDQKAAMERYDAALELCPQHKESSALRTTWSEEGLVGRGAALANLGKAREALKDFDAALRIDPEDANALKYRDIARKRAREAARALRPAFMNAPISFGSDISRVPEGSDEKAAELQEKVRHISQALSAEQAKRELAEGKLKSLEGKVRDYEAALAHEREKWQTAEKQVNDMQHKLKESSEENLRLQTALQEHTSNKAVTSLGPKALAPLTVWVAFTVPRTVSLVLPGDRAATAALKKDLLGAVASGAQETVLVREGGERRKRTGGAAEESIFSTLTAALYRLFFRFAPFLAGGQDKPKVEVLGPFSLSIGNEQLVDTSSVRPKVNVRVKGDLAGEDPRDLEVTFTSFVVELPNLPMVELPLPRPRGRLRTSFCDRELRLSRGGRGGLFVLKRLAP
eukprot:g26472.t1